MKEFEPLDILQEECAEVIQAVSKIRRFGFESFSPYDPSKQTNKDHLVEEIGDVLAVIEIVQKEYDLDEWLMIEAKNRKFEKLKKWSTIDANHLDHPEMVDLTEEDGQRLHQNDDLIELLKLATAKKPKPWWKWPVLHIGSGEDKC